MAVLIDYIWQTTFSLLFFYGVYLVLLRKEKAFFATRAYLLLTPIVALICPLINIPVEFDKPGISLNQTEFFRALSEQEAPEVFVATYGLPEFTVQSTKLPLLLEIKDYLLLGYIAVALCLLIRFFWGLGQIRTLIHSGWSQAKYDIQNRCLVIPTSGKSPVFSFFNKLFWDDTACLHTREKHLIYRHELVHIRQYHSWDVIYFQILGIIFWFNPVLHLMRHAICELHEYMADDEIVAENSEPFTYIRLIANQAIRGIDYTMGSHFAKSLTRSRIEMIKSDKKANILRLAAIFPITLFLVGLISLEPPQDFQNIPDKLTSTIEVIKGKLLSSKDSLSVGIRMNRVSDPEHFEFIGKLEGQKLVAQMGMFEYTFEGIRTADDYRKVRQLIEKLRENALLPLDGEVFRQMGPIDEKAFFPGNPGEWEELVLEKVNLPEWELKMGLGGVIDIEFIVDNNGRVVDPVIKKSIGGGLDLQFLAALQSPSLPRWQPAIYQNMAVNSVQSVSFGIYPGSF